MKVRLMHADREFQPACSPSAPADQVAADLGLGELVDAMAEGDAYLRGIAEHSLFEGLREPEEIRYRQRVVADCIEHPQVIRAMYALAVAGVDTRRDARFFWFRESPGSLLQKSVGMLSMLTGGLRDLRVLADQHGSAFRSEGFTQLLGMLQDQLTDDYLSELGDHLRDLRLRGGVRVSASLGRGNRGTGYVLRTPLDSGLLRRFIPVRPGGHSFAISDRDEAGMETLAQLRDRGVALAANALAQSTDHVLGFFAQLRAELAFYVGCLNLLDRLGTLGLATCFPRPLAAVQDGPAVRGLCDAALALRMGSPVVGSDLAAGGARLIMVTGANQGGKSTFLRSLGLAQLMMQAGMPVTASAFQGPVCAGVFTHFRREEDASMTRGKLEEELARMSEIADRVEPGSLLLCNESFAATNEREGSEIARQVLRAMHEAGIRVVFVTHLYDLAATLHRSPAGVLFLRAERTSDGRRTFRVVPGEPLPTSHGQDSYRRIFAGTGARASQTGHGILGGGRDEARANRPGG
jgi:MutS domain V